MVPSTRLLLALLIAPLASGVLQSALLGQMEAGMFVLVIAYPAVLLFGLPAWMLCSRAGWQKWWQAVVAGVLCGLVFGAFFLLIIASETSMSLLLVQWRALVMFAIHGGVVAVVFWCIARRAMSSNQSLQPTAFGRG
jgi:hypothetical protein